MKHIGAIRRFIGNKEIEARSTICGAEMKTDDTCVVAAMQSDCDACRTHPSIMVARVNDERWDGKGKLGVRPPLEPYTPQPWSVKTREEERQERLTATQHNAAEGSTVGAYSFTPSIHNKPTGRGAKK